MMSVVGAVSGREVVQFSRIYLRLQLVKAKLIKRIIARTM